MDANQFSIIVQAILDKSGISKDLLEIQKIINNNVLKIIPQLETASLKNNIKNISNLIASSLNEAYRNAGHLDINIKGADVAKVLTASLKDMNTTVSASQVKINNLANAMLTFKQNNSNMTKSMKKDLDTMYNSLINGANLSEQEIKELQNRFAAFKLEVRDAGKLGKSPLDSIENGVASFATWLPASQLVMAGINSFRKAIDNVVKLDNSLVELSKVSDLSTQGLEDITDEAYKLGEQLSKTGTDVLDAVTNFKRAGYDISDSMKYAEEALKTTNISENLKDAGQAASSLVNIMKGFQNETPEFASKINDAVNQVSNTEAVDFDNLIDGATRLSAVADQAGMSFEQMLGTLTGGYEILGNMEKVATGQITIFSRLQSIQLDGEDEVPTVAKLQETFNSATKGAVNIVDQTTGQLRNVYDILDDVANVWDSLDKNTREALAIEAAGIRQKNVFLAMMQNWQGVEDAVESAKNSLGSADEENKKYLDSIQGRVENFESATQKLSNTIIDSNDIKNIVDLGTNIIKFFDNVIDRTGILTPLLGGLGAFLGRDKSKQRFCPVW